MSDSRRVRAGTDWDGTTILSDSSEHRQHVISDVRRCVDRQQNRPVSACIGQRTHPTANPEPPLNPGRFRSNASNGEPSGSVTSRTTESRLSSTRGNPTGTYFLRSLTRESRRAGILVRKALITPLLRSEGGTSHTAASPPHRPVVACPHSCRNSRNPDCVGWTRVERGYRPSPRGRRRTRLLGIPYQAASLPTSALPGRCALHPACQHR